MSFQVLDWLRMNEAKFILSAGKLMEQFKIVSSLADEVSYSAKTNYEVASVLGKLTGCFFSLHSIESLDSVSDKRRVWFLAQAWSKDEIAGLIKAGVDKFVVDNEADLKVLLAFLDGKALKISLLLRMRLKENTIYTGKYFVFGMSAAQVSSLLPVLRENPSIGRLGIHFHRKTQNVSEWSLKEELEQSIKPEVFSLIDCVCIGGGLPVKYKNFSADVLGAIFSEVTKLRQWLNGMGIRMIIEPGRFLAAPCVKLEAYIKGVYDNNIVVNCSVYNSDMDAFVASIKLEVDGELDGTGRPFTIKGQTPCSMDIFRYRVFLKNPRVGGKIVFLNAGAYNFASDFCGLKKLETVVVY